MTEYVLDRDRTRIGFVAAHRVGGKVRGHFPAVEGALHIDTADPTASTAWLTVETSSVNTGNPRRDNQLRQDFFGTPTYPAMTFVATTITQTAPGSFDVTGNLTIRGTTHPLTVPLSVTDTGDELHFKASQTINRHTWQANWNAFTTALIHPNVELDLSLTAKRHPPT
ncbi:YceI family protein [Kribbella sp. NPDC003557]|uniref:YceI family protein n=1 Tax=Kribbella sp. NPDC003557 TaxID=3154449 RepID=UPI0033B95CD5